ncbi:hypothetical protein [Clostridium sp. UBA3061]
MFRQVAIKGPWNERNTEDYFSETQIPVKSNGLIKMAVHDNLIIICSRTI